MYQMLMNQKTAAQRRCLKQIQKASLRKYGRGRRAVVRARIGKLVCVFRPNAEEQRANTQTKNGASQALSGEQLLKLIRESRLTGQSGSDFPTIRKLESFLQSKVIKQKGEDCVLVVNGVECEPGLLHDEWLLSEHFDEILEGIQQISKALSIRQSVLAVKTDIRAVGNRRERKGKNASLHTLPDGIRVCRVPAGYPMGEEHILLHQLFGVQLKQEELPTEHGFLVLNVQTVYQIFRLCHETYEEGRYVTLADLDTGEAKVVFAKKGEEIRKTLEENFKNHAGRECFAGIGLLASKPLQEKECFQGSTCFAAIGTPASISNEHSCKGCGKCSRKCPMGVQVREIVKRREKDPGADITGLGAEKCIHCGSCTFFCRAGKNLSALLGQEKG